MATTLRFLAIGDEADAALDWFRQQPESSEITTQPYGELLHFRNMGPLVPLADDSGIDVARSPLVCLFRPVLKREVLWTTCEVHFLPVPLRRSYPRLHDLRVRFDKWLSTFEIVFTGHPGRPGKWNYYLEGSIRDYAIPVYAMPLAMQALKDGQYFVGWFDNEPSLERTCKTLVQRELKRTLKEEEKRANNPDLSNA